MNAHDLGSVGAQSRVRQWQLDDLTFTYIVDGAMSMAPDQFFPAIPERYWYEHPDYLDGDCRAPMSTGGLLVERDGHHTLIDAGFGAVQRDAPVGRIDSGALLDSLAAVGVTAADIDVLALTHLHVDHTGWLFTDTGSGAFEPTFPNASYVLAAAEWAPFARGEEPAEMPDRASVIEPLRLHVRRVEVGDGEEVSPGVTAMVTPGHSVGHTSYVVSSTAGRRLIAFGDIFHLSAQLTHPEWGSLPDAQPAAVPAARATIIAELLRPETFGFAIHFGDQPFGQAWVDTDGKTRWQPLPSDVLAPAPRPR
jgi:glyoxylase-like metal-dependent hydrolase (beta-lactamase superfamily II)